MQDTLLSPEAGIAIHDVVRGNLEHLPALMELFTESFPDYAASLPRIRRKAERLPDVNPRLLEHQWLVTIAGQAAAMMAFKYVCYHNVGIGIYLAVRPAYRDRVVAGHRRMAGWLVATAARQLCLDAERLHRPRPWGLAGEVSISGVLARYVQYGALALPVNYQEPHFINGRVADLAPGEIPPLEWRPAQLALLPIDAQTVNVYDPVLLEDVVAAYLLDHYGLPIEHPQVQQILAGARSVSARAYDVRS